MKRAIIHVAAVYVLCPHCKSHQLRDGVNDVREQDFFFALTGDVGYNYEAGRVDACKSCGLDYTMPALRATVPIAPRERS